jgi:hypothetical protein
MYCARSCFCQMNSFHRYSKQTLYFYSLIQMVYIEVQKISTEFHPQGVESPHHFPTLLKMPAYQFRIPRVGEHMFQLIDHWKVPHQQDMNLSFLVVLLVEIIFVINTLRTDIRLLLILFLHNVNIHMIVTHMFLLFRTFHGFTCIQTSLYLTVVRYLHISCHRSKYY